MFQMLQMIIDPCTVSLLDYNLFDILGLDPHESDFPDPDTLHQAFTRASMHTQPFATSGRLTLPPRIQARLAYFALGGGYRKLARAFWRAHHISTWNPHADVGSSEAGLPIPGQQGALSPEEAELLKAATIASVESGDSRGARELGERDGSGPSLTKFLLLLSEHGDSDRDRDSRCDHPTLPAVMLGSFPKSVETNERANAVVALLDRRGRYYCRIVPWTMAGKPLPVEDDSIIPYSCDPAFINYLPRFQDISELEVMAMVREELAHLQAQVDAKAPTGPDAV
ncbi:MAG: hypothetical protein M1826_003924 [Phylliscum demangeonii]|nr:MAG: hypothetical protein M1826_003924 [Phylliscum demangeonii]